MDPKLTSCESCNKELLESSLLKHIGTRKDCKAYYGRRYDDMKKEKINERKRTWRKVKGKKELERQRQLYKENSIAKLFLCLLFHLNLTDIHICDVFLNFQ